jgi:hypothetical protein
MIKLPKRKEKIGSSKENHAKVFQWICKRLSFISVSPIASNQTSENILDGEKKSLVLPNRIIRINSIKHVTEIAVIY